MADRVTSLIRTRQIKIKTGVVKRLAREEASYVTEARQQEERIERMKAVASGRDDENDECDIRKQEEVLQECYMMIPDCRRRLAAAHADLLRTLEGVAGGEEEDPELVASQEFRDARGLLDSVKTEEEDARGLLDSVKMEEDAGPLLDDCVMKMEEEEAIGAAYERMEKKNWL